VAASASVIHWKQAKKKELRGQAYGPRGIRAGKQFPKPATGEVGGTKREGNGAEAAI